MIAFGVGALTGGGGVLSYLQLKRDPYLDEEKPTEIKTFPGPSTVDKNLFKCVDYTVMLLN